MEKVKNIIILIAFIVTLFISASVCNAAENIEDSRSTSIQKQQILRTVYSPRFLPDNDRIMFIYDYQGNNWEYSYKLGIYEISSGKFYQYDKLPKEFGSIYPYFSRDGKKIVFRTGKGNKSDLYVMNDGKNLKKLTNSPELVISKDGNIIAKQYNTNPSFSMDGRKIIFARGPLSTEYLILRIGRWDYYEIDLENDKETKLTNHGFDQASPPYYYLDGEKIVFSAQLKQPYWPGSNLYVIDKNKGFGEIKPLVEGAWDVDNPRVSWDGKILFKAFSNDENENETANTTKEEKNKKARAGWNIFVIEGRDIKSTKEISAKSKKLTAEYSKQDNIIDFDISPDGKRVVFIKSDKGEQQRNCRLWLVNSDGSVLTKIEVPWEQLK